MSDFYIDYKTTIWQRAKFKDEESLNLALEAYKKYDIDVVFNDEIGFIENEILYDTEYPVSLEENGGFSTIEVYSNKYLIYKNGN
jgi:uncharacterized protein YydD (DUF2326 family)